MRLTKVLVMPAESINVNFDVPLSLDKPESNIIQRPFYLPTSYWELNKCPNFIQFPFIDGYVEVYSTIAANDESLDEIDHFSEEFIHSSENNMPFDSPSGELGGTHFIFLFFNLCTFA